MNPDLARKLLVLLTLAPLCAGAGAATTGTFGGGDATWPDTMKIDGKSVKFDLSAVGRAEVFRAVFRPKRPVFNGQDERALLPVAVTADGTPLSLMPPRYRSFDATAAVRVALKGGAKLVLQVKSLPGWDGKTARLEVTHAGKTKGDLPSVRGLTARHRGGQTILTFREHDPPLAAESAKAREVRALKKKLAAAPRLTYRVYRSTKPITAASIGQAELVDEIAPLSCWNDEYHGIYPKPDAAAMRYVVEDGKDPVPPGTGIYAHNPAKAGKVWYAVTVAVEGAESLDTFGKGNAVGPVEESVGPGEPILQRVETPDKFAYRPKPELRYYVRWEAPPRCNVPSRPFDYLVGLPEKPKWPAPIYLAFHCWGANLNGGYGWWYQRPPATSVLVSTNQIPYDWWTGYHEAMGTWRPWSAGVVRSYTQKRYDAFVEWVCGQWRIDRTRTVVGGNSMGGGGSLAYGLRRGGLVSWGSGWVGVHRPAGTPHFLGSFELCYGRVGWKLKHADGLTAFDCFDDAAWLRRHPTADVPLLCFGNGKDDGGIGWPQALEYFRALQETRQPHVFHWALGGHGVRATLPGPGASGNTLPLDVRTDQSLPAFTKCSLDEDPGTGALLPKPAEHRGRDGRVRRDKYDGDPEGHANRWLYWKTADIVDEPGRWEMTVALTDAAPAGECTAAVTPRRLQRFKAKPGETFAWTSADDGKAVQRGKVTADRWGLLTVENVKITKGGNRLRIERQE